VSCGRGPPIRNADNSATADDPLSWVPRFRIADFSSSESAIRNHKSDIGPFSQRGVSR